MLRTRTELHLKAVAHTSRSATPLVTALVLAACAGLSLPQPAVAVRAQIGAATGTASSQATAKAQHEIEAIVRLQSTAMEHKDVDATDRPYTDDYRIDDMPGGGPVNKASRDETTKELMGVAQTIHIQATIEHVQLSADGKTATVVEKTHLVFTSYPKKNEKSHTVVLDGSASEVWVKVSAPKATWLKRSKKSLAMTEAMDGVPYRPEPPAASQPPPPTAPANPANPPGSTQP